MAEVRTVHFCEKCKQIVEVLFEGKGVLSCCGQPMKQWNPQTEDFAFEKHVPYIEKVDGGVRVLVGKEEDHPMADAHYIAYIEICADGVLMRKYLKPGDKPEAFFATDAKVITAKELCNVHGVWVYNQ
ncbi:MAG: desulfoferrodoxin family protein [Candidatus Methanomethylophilaceae archaeon]|jgi:superoxide reductase